MPVKLIENNPWSTNEYTYRCPALSFTVSIKVYCIEMEKNRKWTHTIDRCWRMNASKCFTQTTKEEQKLFSLFHAKVESGTRTEFRYCSFLSFAVGFFVWSRDLCQQKVECPQLTSRKGAKKLRVVILQLNINIRATTLLPKNLYGFESWKPLSKREWNHTLTHTSKLVCADLCSISCSHEVGKKSNPSKSV